MSYSIVFSTAFNAVAPIVLLILLGYFLKRVGFLSRDFLKIGNKLVFNWLLPAMLFINVYDIAGFASIRWGVVGYCVALVMLLFFVGLALALMGTKVPQRRGVIWQCVYRSNFAIIGLSLAAAIGGDDAVAMAAVVSSVTVPLFNILAVISLSTFTSEHSAGKADISKVLRNIAKNPLIISVALGLVCLCLRELQQAIFSEVVFSMRVQLKFLYTALNNMKSAATPLALIVMGGQFEFSAVKGLKKEIITGVLGRVILSPLLGVGCAALLSVHGILGFGAEEFPSLVALFGSPVAISSAVMAGSMGGDEQLATQLVVWTSILSVVTIFAQVCLLMSMGLLAV